LWRRKFLSFPKHFLFVLSTAQVTKGKKWADLGRLLGYSGISGLSTQIKNSYTRVILPYEHWCEHVRASPLASLATAPRGDSQLRTHTNMQKRPWSAGGSASGRPDHDDSLSPPDSPLTESSSPLSEPPDESEVKEEPDEGAPRRRRGRASTASEQKTRSLPQLVGPGSLLIFPFPSISL
jgi:histone demethylase JARID1